MVTHIIYSCKCFDNSESAGHILEIEREIDTTARDIISGEASEKGNCTCKAFAESN